MKIKMSLLSIFLLLSLSCVTTKTPVYNQPAIDKPVQVIVKYFTVSGTEKNNYSGSINFGRELAENTASYLQMKGINAIAVSELEDLKTDYLIKGDIIRLDTGSQGLRFFGLITPPIGVAFMALGSGSLKVDARVFDINSSKAVLEYDGFQKTALISFLRDDENVMKELCIETAEIIASDLANAIGNKEYILKLSNTIQKEVTKK